MNIAMTRPTITQHARYKGRLYADRPSYMVLQNSVLDYTW